MSYAVKRVLKYFLLLCMYTACVILIAHICPDSFTRMGNTLNPTRKQILHIGQKVKTTDTFKEEERMLFDPRYSIQKRIQVQMKHVPYLYKQALQNGVPPRTKQILQYNIKYKDDISTRLNTFRSCPVNRCELTFDRRRISEMDAVIFDKRLPHRARHLIPSKQIWVLRRMEGPSRFNFGMVTGDQYNWTITYRQDSTIPTPYGLFFLNTSHPPLKENNDNYTANKTKKVAWLASNCDHTTNDREKYVKQLSKFIQVDRFGKCGNKTCSNFGTVDGEKCVRNLLKDYKFYLAFENSNCRHYVTEKVFKNGFKYGLLPIVMGPPKEDYEAIVPPNSYIYAYDFESPESLAKYLHKLDKNDTLYNSYFKWIGTGRFAKYMMLWCRLCSLLHEQDTHPPSWYQNGFKWWRGNSICRPPGAWDEETDDTDMVLSGWRIFE